MIDHIQSPEQIQKLKASIHHTIVGKDQAIDLMLTCLLASGHLLIEDVPGVGKTSLASALSRSIDGQFGRIQFTSDLMPSDVIGVSVFNNKTQSFEFHTGPIFANIVLADEINRTTPKTQSALLEAMQEKQVTVDRVSHPLPKPFMVIATQNPIDQTGTYHLPESQLDRFLFKMNMGYPLPSEEIKILSQNDQTQHQQELACKTTDILKMQSQVLKVKVDASLSTYILNLVDKTRNDANVKLGVSPRGSMALYRASQAYAYLNGRNYVIPDDIKFLSPYVLAHRVLLKATNISQDEKTNARIQKNYIENVLEQITVPM